MDLHFGWGVDFPDITSCAVDRSMGAGEETDKNWLLRMGSHAQGAIPAYENDKKGCVG